MPHRIDTSYMELPYQMVRKLYVVCVKFDTYYIELPATLACPHTINIYYIS